MSLPCVKGGSSRKRDGRIVKAKVYHKTIPQPPSACCGGGVITPGVIGVSAYFRARFVIDSYNVALEILFEEIEIEHAMRIGWI